MIRACTIAIMMLVLRPAHAMEPFGTLTTPSASVELTGLWLGLQAELARDEAEINRCRTDVECGSVSARRLLAILDEVRPYAGRKLYGLLNRSINSAIQATHAIVPWLAPLAALGRPGDCKSYAIVKYLALGELGIPASDRRLIMLRKVSRPNDLHLVALVKFDDRWIILDNQTLTLVDSRAAHQYEPLNAFDAHGVRDFETRGQHSVSGIAVGLLDPTASVDRLTWGRP
jgi:predicted transglutaminase-like cysteine proteinase